MATYDVNKFFSGLGNAATPQPTAQPQNDVVNNFFSTITPVARATPTPKPAPTPQPNLMQNAAQFVASAYGKLSDSSFLKQAPIDVLGKAINPSYMPLTGATKNSIKDNAGDFLGKVRETLQKELSGFSMHTKVYSPAEENDNSMQLTPDNKVIQNKDINTLVKEYQLSPQYKEDRKRNIFTGNLFSGLTGGIVKPHTVAPENLTEKVTGATGEILGSLTALKGIGKVVDGIVAGSTTIGKFIDTYPRVAKYVVPFLKSAASFDIYGQLDPDLKDRFKKLGQDTLLAVPYSLLGHIPQAKFSVPASFGLGFGLAKLSGASNEDAFISGSILGILDGSGKLQEQVTKAKVDGLMKNQALDVLNGYSETKLDKSSTPAEIRKVYIDLVKQYHPDTGGDVTAFKSIASAYEFLTGKTIAPQFYDKAETAKKEQLALSEQAQTTKDTIKEEQQITKYRDQFKGKLLNTDNVRELFKPEGYNRINSANYQDKASALSNKIFNQDVQNLQPGEKFLFTAGSSGAGKSSALDKYPDLTKDIKAGLDGNFSSASSIDKLGKVIEKGGDASVVFVHRDPVDAWINGVVKRAVNPDNRRVVPMDVFLENLVESPKRVLEAKKKFGDKMELAVLDNSHGPKKAKLVKNPLEFVEKLDYNKDNVKKEILKATAKAIKDGTISNQETAKALLGKYSQENAKLLESVGRGKTKPTVEVSSSVSSTPSSTDVPPVPEKPVSKTIEKKAAPIVEKPQEVNPTSGAPLPVGDGKVKDSKAYTRVLDRLKEETKIKTQYNVMNLEKDAQKAADFIEKDPSGALRVAMGIDAPPAGQTETAIAIALADRASQEGQFELQSQLESARSLRQTRRGQEIVSERGRFNDNSPYHFIQELMDRRLKSTGSGIFKTPIQDMLKRDGAKQRAVEKIDRQAKELKKVVTKAQSKIEMAQSIIDSLRC